MAYVVTAKWTARDDNVDEVRDAILQLIEPSRNEPGNLYYQPSQDLEDPRIFFIYELYEDEDAYKAHGESEHFQALALGKAIPMLESRERVYYATVGELR